MPVCDETLTLDRGEVATEGDEIAALANGELPTRDAGRYAIEGEHGRGGLGRVLVARDRELGRTIALKEMRREGAADEQRFCREARITARLEHPGIVPVYDAGRWPGGKPFYVMKLVQGRSLKELLTETTSFNERLALLANVLAVAEAVAYGHNKGIIHRDLKPSNIIVGDYGETVVIDWGLAKEVSWREQGELAQAQSTDSMAPPPTLTGHGGVLGTPSFMSPEQASGQPVDQRTDVYALGAILYEVLTGQRPYQGASPQDIVARVQREGPVPADKLEPKIPAELAAIIAKAMERDPARRYPSAAELGQDLRRYQTGKLVAAHRYTVRQRLFRSARKHRAWIAASALGGVAVVALVRSAAPPPCRGMEEKLAGVWNDRVKQAIRASFVATGRPYAEDTFDRVQRALDRHATSWVEMRTEACEATHVRGEQSDRLFDLRMQCLDRRLGELGALTTLFADNADGDVVDKAVQATSKLESLQLCADANALQAAYPPPPNSATQSKVDRLRKRLARANALEAAGKYHEGLAIASKVVAEAKQTDYPPLRAETLYLHGRLLERTGDAEGAEQVLHQAARWAAEAKDDPGVAKAWTELVWVVGYRTGRYDEAIAIGPFAEVAIARAGGQDLVRARLLNSLGIVLWSQGKYDEARRHYERALAIKDKALGPGSPSAARSRNNLGIVYRGRGNYAEARKSFERAVAIIETALGPDHPDAAKALGNLGVIYRDQGEYAAARQFLERALTIFKRAFGPDHHWVANALGNLGEVFREEGKHAEAVRYLERALAIGERALGPDHVEVANIVHYLGTTLCDQGKYAAAEGHARRALAVKERGLGAAHPFVASSLTVLGRIELGRRLPGAALPFLERALAIQHSAGIRNLEFAETQFALARGLWDARRDRKRALALAKEARGIYASLGEGRKKERTAIERWLAKRSPPSQRLQSSRRAVDK